MASSSVPKAENQLIENIDMECYGSTKGLLTAIRVGPCICFAAILNDGQEVFVEHRSDTFSR
jgi:hypothetical protein